TVPVLVDGPHSHDGEAQVPRDVVRKTIRVQGSVETRPILREPREVHAAGEGDVGVHVVEGEARGYGLDGGMAIDEQPLRRRTPGAVRAYEIPAAPPVPSDHGCRAIQSTISAPSRTSSGDHGMGREPNDAPEPRASTSTQA